MNLSYKVSSQLDEAKYVYTDKAITEGSVGVEDVMSEDVITLTPEENLKRADEIMRTKAIKHLPVVDEAGHLIGLVTDKDVLESVCANLSCMGECKREDLLTSITVSDVMRGGVIVTYLGTPLRVAAREMMSYRINSLPVVDENELLQGIITESDFVEYFANSKYH
jgi:CBS domain-containing protein